MSEFTSLIFRLLCRPVENWERFGTMSYLDAAPFEQLNQLAGQPYRMTSGRLSTLQETMQNMESAVCRAQGTGDGVDTCGRGAAYPR